jgi:hypothetical protein
MNMYGTNMVAQRNLSVSDGDASPTTHHYSRESVNLGFEQILDSVVSAPPGLLPSSGNGSPKAGQPHHPSFSIYTTQKCLCESG